MKFSKEVRCRNCKYFEPYDRFVGYCPLAPITYSNYRLMYSNEKCPKFICKIDTGFKKVI